MDWQSQDTMPIGQEILVTYLWPDGTRGYAVETLAADGTWEILDDDENVTHWAALLPPSA